VFDRLHEFGDCCARFKCISPWIAFCRRKVVGGRNGTSVDQEGNSVLADVLEAVELVSSCSEDSDVWVPFSEVETGGDDSLVPTSESDNGVIMDSSVLVELPIDPNIVDIWKLEEEVGEGNRVKVSVVANLRVCKKEFLCCEPCGRDRGDVKLDVHLREEQVSVRFTCPPCPISCLVL